MVLDRSGPEFVDRVAREDGLLGEHELAKGETVRSRMGVESYSANEKLQLLFGPGARTCLGKSISQHAWTCFVKRACELNTILRADERVMQPFSEPFRMPQKAVVTVGAR